MAGSFEPKPSKNKNKSFLGTPIYVTKYGVFAKG